MKVTIEVTVDNAAFEDPTEFGRILGTARRKAERVINLMNSLKVLDDSKINLRDINGNTVGFVRLEE